MFTLTPFVPKPKPVKPVQEQFGFAKEKEPQLTTFARIPEGGYFLDLAFRSFRNVGGGFAMDSDSDPNSGKLFPFSPDEPVLTEVNQ